jgi:thiamine biosynthesis lipoprotein
MEHHTRFRAMNTDVDVIIEADGPLPPLDAFVEARVLFEQQEARFSRFRTGSLVVRLNAGETVADRWLATACRLALEAWGFTGGLFNPLVLGALEEAGYDRSFEAVRGGAPRRQDVPTPADCLAIEGDRVWLRGGARLDLGGIVKGWTVDLAVERLRERYSALLVNAGGDMRCAGAEPGWDGWEAAVAGPDGADAWEGVLRGAMATSSTLERRWRAGEGRAHHLIDPRTGLPSASPFVQATVWADECRVAECWAKAIVIGGPEALAACDAAGWRALAM